MAARTGTTPVEDGLPSGVHRGWGCNGVASLWLPTTADDGKVKLPSRHASLVSYKGKKWVKGGRKRKELVLKNRTVEDLCSFLGLSKKDATIFSSRSLRNVRRTEEEIKGIVDAFLLASPAFFISNEENRAFFIFLLRQIIKTSTYDVDMVTKFFKEFCNYLWLTKTKSLTLEEPRLSRGNFFARALDHSLIRGIDLEKGKKEEFQFLAHLTSTRQLVAGGKRVLRESLKGFEAVTSERFQPQKEGPYYGDPFMAGYAVGRKVKRRYSRYPTNAAHVSLNSAGSFSSTSEEGGRFVEINNDLKEILLVVPEEDREVHLPLGFKAKDVKGLARWRTWARETFLEIGEFGELSERAECYGEVRRSGFDHALGHQIFLVALYIAQLEGYINERGEVLRPIPARSLSVPEPGGKSRVVTTTLWWNVILQQPGGHTIKGLLKYHPSAESGLERTDQAWNYVPLLNQIEPIEDGLILSSDLKEATDALDPDCVFDIAQGFFLAQEVYDPLTELALRLVTSERFIFTDESVFIKKRGILMGEPMTKGLLALYNLAVEEQAIRMFDGSYDPSIWNKPIQYKWRAFHVGGDDHIAYGPERYLNTITSVHLAWGSKISMQKHGMSRIAVKYCEKVITLKGSDLKLDQRAINSSTEGYRRSCWVDSVKVRLLAPISKSEDLQNDRNIAIGKAKSLGRTLRWLQPGTYPEGYAEMVRERFFRRMMDYLPKEGTSLFYQLLLPEELGGLDLALSGEIENFFWALPMPTKLAIQNLLKGEMDDYQWLVLKSLTTSDIERGVKELLTVSKGVRYQEDHKLTLMAELPKWIPVRPLWEVKQELQISSDLSLKKTIEVLRTKGWWTYDDFIRTRQRPRLFEKMLSGNVEVQKYSTMPWKKRYALIWDILMNGDKSQSFPPLREKEIDEGFLRDSLKRLEKIHVHLPLRVVYAAKETSYPNLIGKGFIDGSFMEEALHALPDLSLGDLNRLMDM
jgi:hypothetical protein